MVASASPWARVGRSTLRLRNSASPVQTWADAVSGRVCVSMQREPLNREDDEEDDQDDAAGDVEVECADGLHEEEADAAGTNDPPEPLMCECLRPACIASGL